MLGPVRSGGGGRPQAEGVRNRRVEASPVFRGLAAVYRPLGRIGVAHSWACWASWGGAGPGCSAGAADAGAYFCSARSISAAGIPPGARCAPREWSSPSNCVVTQAHGAPADDDEDLGPCRSLAGTTVRCQPLGAAHRRRLVGGSGRPDGKPGFAANPQRAVLLGRRRSTTGHYRAAGKPGGEGNKGAGALGERIWSRDC